MSLPTANSRRQGRAAARAVATSRPEGSRRRSQIQAPGCTKAARLGSSPRWVCRPLATDSPARKAAATSPCTASGKRPPEGANPTTATWGP